MIEDIFSENLVDEPDDIERVIEDGEEFRRDNDGGSSDEAKEKDQEEKEKEKPKIRKTMGPRTVLNAQRLKGPRGIATMEEFFKGIKLDGRRGKEAKDLDVVMKRLELWTHRLYPRGQFDDCLKKIEKLGTNKTVRNYITRIRLGMEDGSGESDVIRDEPNSPPPATSTSHDDPFDQLVSSTTGPEVTSGSNTEMTTEQRERMLMNRLIAEEKRAARIKKAQELKERFKTQQASNSQSVKGGVSSIEPRRNGTQDQRLENSAGTLQMEVDENHDSTGVNVSINQWANEENLKKRSNHGQECSTSEVEEMLVSSQDNCKHVNEENISQNNGVKQNENKTTEEMETCEVTSTVESLTTENHIVSKEELQLKDKHAIIESHCKVRGKEMCILKDQKDNGDQADCFEKENENPNSH